MALTFGPNLGLLVNGNQGEAHYAELMKFLRGVDALTQLCVEDKDLSTPPGSPADGVCYIVGASPTGAWAGWAGRVARYSSVAAAWESYVPKNGWRGFVRDESLYYRFNGTSWVAS